jgi:hypothetical protein
MQLNLRLKMIEKILATLIALQPIQAFSAPSDLEKKTDSHITFIDFNLDTLDLSKYKLDWRHDLSREIDKIACWSGSELYYSVKGKPQIKQIDVRMGDMINHEAKVVFVHTDIAEIKTERKFEITGIFGILNNRALGIMAKYEEENPETKKIEIKEGVFGMGLNKEFIFVGQKNLAEEYKTDNFFWKITDSIIQTKEEKGEIDISKTPIVYGIDQIFFYLKEYSKLNSDEKLRKYDFTAVPNYAGTVKMNMNDKGFPKRIEQQIKIQESLEKNYGEVIVQIIFHGGKPVVPGFFVTKGNTIEHYQLKEEYKKEDKIIQGLIPVNEPDSWIERGIDEIWELKDLKK